MQIYPLVDLLVRQYSGVQFVGSHVETFLLVGHDVRVANVVMVWLEKNSSGRSTGVDAARLVSIRVKLDVSCMKIAIVTLMYIISVRVPTAKLNCSYGNRSYGVFHWSTVDFYSGNS